MSKAPIPTNESDRLATLRALDLDYSELEAEFQYFVTLVSRTTGMEASLVNLIDRFGQWTIANYGLSLKSMAREDSVCQFTILENDHLEVKDLAIDENHKDKFYVSGDPYFRYYFGVPLKTSTGVHIGSLCVLDRESKTLSTEQIANIKLIAEEVVNKLKGYKLVRELRNELQGILKEQKTIAVELQDSLAGIIGISDVLMDKEIFNTPADAESFISLINERSKSMVELTGKLIRESGSDDDVSGIRLDELKEKIAYLYGPLAHSRELKVETKFNESKNHIQFCRSTVFAALNYPIAGAFYSSQAGSSLAVNLDIDVSIDGYILRISVSSDSKPLPEASQLCPPEHPESDFKFFSGADGWHCELSLPVQVI